MRNCKILINKQQIFTGITSFMLAVYLFQIDSLLNNGIYQFFIKLSVFVAFAYLLSTSIENHFGRYLLYYKLNYTDWFMILYAISMIISNYRNSGLNLNVIMLSVCQIFLFFVMHIAAQKKYLKSALKGLRFYFFIICIINDWIWISNGFQPLIEGNTHLGLLPQFFLGNKFSVMYYHIILVALFLMLYKGRNRKKWILLCGPLLIVLSLSFDCATTSVVSLAFMIMLLLEGKRKSLFENKTTILIAITTGAIFPFISQKIMNIGFIQNIVTNLLGRGVTLTGRTNIFKSILTIARQSLVWGFGRLDALSTISFVTGAANIQNSLWQIIITYGIIGAFLLICVVASSIRQSQNNNLEIHGYTALILIYTFILAGFVEITYGITLLLPVAIYNAINERMS